MKTGIARNIRRMVLFWLALAFLFSGVQGVAAAPMTTAGRPFPYQVVRSYPHDREAFTQGLVYADGVLYEGTGLNGRSSLRKVELTSGRVLKEVRLPPAYFGEGIALFGDRIIQVTWQSRLGFVYDKDTFRLLTTFTYPHEAWGLTQDGKQLVMSDGTEVLHFLDPTQFRETRTLRVHDERGPVKGINELEYVRGALYANLWPTEEIVVIDLGTGRVRERFVLPGLLDPIEAAGVDVLNGIAYDARGDRFFVTGKFWPKLFELKRRSP
ncbi:MAG: glutaminyl-peptide cyclotransferase [Deltaproteobacteria bacterium]|nr:glutaminyl-peptide cyclotransferase [Deltaproteobacteria bacterium]